MCNCKRSSPLPFSTEKKIKVIINKKQILIGKKSEIIYGLRKPGQKFYILKEDFDSEMMERVENG